ncbi:MAG: hypothetical protein Q7J06_12010 [Bacteroidales bacterium]|nr:hypothetical protein [Bacteroidales bacterium]
MSITGDNLVGTGEKELNSGQPLILRFYAWADPSQMPLRRILVKKDTSETSPTVLQADSIGNRKPKCTDRGWCYWDEGDAYKYQIPCDGNWDCVFYEDGIKDTEHLVQGVCEKFPSNYLTPNEVINNYLKVVR